ncbi:MAG: urease accessory protein UreF [Pseudorhodobacter sp.]
MAMDAPSAIPTETARLLAVQLLSPAFPTGAFAYSQGLEWVMAEGIVTNGATLLDWLEDVLTHGAGWSDAVLLSLALRPGADHRALDELGRALCLSTERLIETMEQGAGFARVAAGVTNTPDTPAALPVAIGRACGHLGLPRAEVIALFLQGQALNLIQAAIRFMQLGQGEGQVILARLAPAIRDLANRAANAGEDALGGCAIGAELAAMHHESMETRIFRT